MVVSAMSVSEGNENNSNSGEVPATLEGIDLRIAFNARYLKDFLGAVSSEEITLIGNGSSSPVVLRPVGDENYTPVLMPMFVQW